MNYILIATTLYNHTAYANLRYGLENNILQIMVNIIYLLIHLILLTH